MRTTTCSTILTLSLLGGAGTAAAQQPSESVPGTPAGAQVDTRWTAWLGCWRQLEETVRSGNVVDPGTRDAVPTPGVMVCVTPSGDPGGVRLSTIMEKQVAFEETVIADGTSWAIDEPGCSGSQRTRWSAHGRRLFVRAELSCADGTTRTISGLTTIAPGPVWVDIQVVNTGGRESIRVRRYRRSPDQSHVSAHLTEAQISGAAMAAAQQARSFNLEEVKEASTQLMPSAIEAALLETDARFPLNAKRLQELDSAGVPDRVLDLMIALSFPKKFVVERRTSSSFANTYGGAMFDNLWWIDPGYGAFPYHYAPFAYGMWGRYDYYYYGAPAYGVVVGSSSEPQRSGEGRVVDGLGYTRVRARAPEPVNAAGFVGADGSSGTSSSTGGSTSSGGVSSQGYSSGGGGDSGRTAVARPPD